jgi:hypothetical protein
MSFELGYSFGLGEARKPLSPSITVPQTNLELWLSARSSSSYWTSDARTTNSTPDDTTGNGVVYCDDQSGNGNDFSRDESNQQTPRFALMSGASDEGRGLGPDSKAFLSFPSDGSNGNRLLTCENTTLGQFNSDDEFTFAALLRLNSSTVRVLANRSGNVGILCHYFSGGLNFRLQNGSNSNEVTLSLSQDTWYWVVWTWDGTSSVDVSNHGIYLNGAVQSPTETSNEDPGTITNSTALGIGYIPGPNIAGDFDFAELMVYSAALSGESLSDLNSYISTYYPSYVS